MKIKAQAIFLVATVLAVAALIVSCSNVDSERQTVDNIKTVVYDGCQYLVFESSIPAGNNYVFSMTHKGNCTNEIHKNHRP